MDLNKLYLLNDSDVLFENFGDEIVVINLKSGFYYSINEPGMLIWELLTNKLSTGQITNVFRKFSTDFKQELASDIEKFVLELETEGLFVLSGDNAVDNEDFEDLYKKMKFGNGKELKKPLIEKYTDQRELLLLDPIHEVSDMGWPDRKREGPEGE